MPKVSERERIAALEDPAITRLEDRALFGLDA